jgi:hypothetical protein
MGFVTFTPRRFRRPEPFWSLSRDNAPPVDITTAARKRSIRAWQWWQRAIDCLDWTGETKLQHARLVPGCGFGEDAFDPLVTFNARLVWPLIPSRGKS